MSKIIILDDNPKMLQLYWKNLMPSENLQPHGISDFDRFMEEIQKENYDVAILNYGTIIHNNSYDFAIKDIKKCRPEIPLIVVGYRGVEKMVSGSRMYFVDKGQLFENFDCLLSKINDCLK